ncbi:MAG: LPS-assembly protein LptD [bacterium]
MGMLVGFLAAVVPSFALEKTPPVNLQADRLYWMGSSVIGQGNAQLEYKDVQLKADEIVVNLDNLDLLAGEDVNLQIGPRTLRGKDLRYNLKSETGTIRSPRWKEGLLFYRAEKADFSSQVIDLKRADFTSCDYSLPHYKIRARKAQVYPGDKIIMKSVALYLGSLPIFWTPYLIQYLHKKNRVMLPSPGYSDFSGWYVQTGYYFYSSASFQGRLRLDYREKKGWGEGVDVFYKSKAGEGEIKTYYVKEADTREERWSLRLRYRQSLSKSTHLKIRLDRLSDKNFLDDYFGEEYKTSYLYLRHRKPNYNVGVLVEPSVNPSFERGFIERLPQIRQNLESRRLGKSGFYLDQAAEVTNFRKEDKNIVRADSFLDLSYPLIAFKYFRLRPKLGYHLFRYWYTKDQKEEEGYRSIPYQELNLLFKIGGKFGNYSHMVNPSLTYYHSSEIKNDFSLPFSLGDHAKKTGDIHPANLLKLDLRNDLYHRRRRLVSARISLDYDLTKKTERFSPLEGKFRLTPPVPHLNYLYLYLLYHPYAKEYKKIESDLSLKGKIWNLTLGLRKYTDDRVTDFITRGGIKFGKYQIAVSIRYDLEGKRIREEAYSFQRDLHCWTARLFLKNKYGAESEKEYWIMFYIKAFPHHWIKYHPEVEELEYR